MHTFRSLLAVGLPGGVALLTPAVAAAERLPSALEAPGDVGPGHWQPAYGTRPVAGAAASTGSSSYPMLPGDPLREGVARREEARALWGRDRPEEGLARALEAVEFLEEAHAAAEHAADSVAVLRELAEARNMVGLLSWALARYEAAAGSYEIARSLWVELNDPEGLGRVYNNLGATYYQWGYYDLALESFLSAFAFREARADTAGMARVLANVGLVRLDWEQVDDAEKALRQSVDLAETTSDPVLRSYAHQTLAGLHLKVGDLDAAEAGFRLAESLLPPGTPSQNSLGLAMVWSARGNHADAVELLEGLEEEVRMRGQLRHQASALLHLGRVHLASSELDRAQRRLEEALAVAEAQDIRPLKVEILEVLARVQEGRGDLVAALALLRRHQTLRQALFSQGTGQRLAAAAARLEADRQASENLQLRTLRAEQEAQLARQRVVGFLAGALLLTFLSFLVVLVHFNRRGRDREEALAGANADLASTNRQLTRALQENRALRGLIPICSHCKKVRDDHGYWEAVETYISERSEALFSHSICTDCGPRIYGDDWVDGPDGPFPSDEPGIPSDVDRHVAPGTQARTPAVP